MSLRLLALTHTMAECSMMSCAALACHLGFDTAIKIDVYFV